MKPAFNNRINNFFFHDVGYIACIFCITASEIELTKNHKI